MGREPRVYHRESVYHLTAHGVDDRPIFHTHYHLVLRPTEGRIGDGMRVLNGAHSRTFNARHGRRGALFESRYRDREIRDERHLAEAIQYVEWNAVIAGIVADPRDWPWSTYADAPLRGLLKGCLTP